MEGAWSRVFSCSEVYAEDGSGFLWVYAFLVVLLDVCLTTKGQLYEVNTDLYTNYRIRFSLFILQL